MSMRHAAVTALVAILACGPAFGAGDPRKGSEGLVELGFRIANGGGVPMSCDARLAHWFADHLLTLEPGAQGGFVLWADAGTGTVYRLNDAGDRMPVERLWCGRDGASWETRSEIDLPRLSGAPAGAADLVCDAGGAGTRCAAR